MSKVKKYFFHRWQNHSSSSVYPIEFINAVYFSVRDDGVIHKLAAYIVLRINENVSIIIGENEDSKYWLNVFNNLKNHPLF